MKRVGIFTVRFFLAALFLYASLPKIADPAAFAQDVYYYRLLPDAAVNLVAIFLPWLELLCAVALLVAPSWRTSAYLLLLSMLAVFTVAVAVNVVRGVDISCGCFASASETIGWDKVLENVWLMFLCVFGLIADRRNRGK